MTDPFDLQHFLDAQPPVYPRVLAELRRGPRRPDRRMAGVLPAAFPASLGLAGFTRCRSDQQGHFSGVAVVAASLDGAVRSGPAGPSTTSGSPRLYSGATRT